MAATNVARPLNPMAIRYWSRPRSCLLRRTVISPIVSRRFATAVQRVVIARLIPETLRSLSPRKKSP